MRVTWLGQAGLFFETDSGVRIMIDPYLSNRLETLRGIEMRRKTPIDNRFLEQEIDVLVLSHEHGDHTDPDTLKRLFSQKKEIDVLASYSAWKAVRDYSGCHNMVMFNAGTEWSYKDVTFRAIPAVHNDFYAVGVQFVADGVSVYVTGDTLYTQELVEAVQKCKIDCIFPVINGKGNNMNAFDAARMTRQMNPKYAFPLHWDTFEKFMADPDEFLQCLTDSDVIASIMKQYASFEIKKEGEK